MEGKTDLQPEMIVIAGPNGSGKTSVTRKFLHHEWAEAVLKAANYCSDLRETCLKEKKSFVFETVMSAEDKLDFILRAKEQGFFVRLFFIATRHPSINAARIALRVMQGGHDVPISKTGIYCPVFLVDMNAGSPAGYCPAV